MAEESWTTGPEKAFCCPLALHDLPSGLIRIKVCIMHPLLDVMWVIKILNTVSYMEMGSYVQKSGHDIPKHNYVLNKILIESAKWPSE
jgi:hypothetical protein